MVHEHHGHDNDHDYLIFSSKRIGRTGIESPACLKVYCSFIFASSGVGGGVPWIGIASPTLVCC